MRLRMESVSTDMQLQIAEQRSLRLLLHAGLTRCANQVQRIVQLIFVANIALFHSIVRSALNERAIPQRVLFDEPAVLEDAFGRHMPIHTQCINSWEVISAYPQIGPIF